MSGNKVLFVMSQPTQSVEPFYILSNSPEIEIVITFLSENDPGLWQGEEFLNKQALNLKVPTFMRIIPLKNVSPYPSLNSRFGLIHPSIVSYVDKYDCIVIYGHAYVSMWLAIIAARLKGKKIILSNDAISYRTSSKFKRLIKKIFYRFLYNHLANAVLVPSSAAVDFLTSLGVGRKNIYLTPYVVDNQRIKNSAKALDKNKLRNQLNIARNENVILFVGKMIQRKRPLDLLYAFSRLSGTNTTLLYVGDGPILSDLKSEISRLNLSEKVRCLGNLDYEQLIQIYVASDILVHPADHEPWGLIVNEAMLCDLPVVVSDQVGSARDLILEGKTGITYPVGDINSLSKILDELFADKDQLRNIAIAAHARIDAWSPAENAAAYLKAFQSIL